VPARHGPFKTAGQIGPIGISYFPNLKPNLTAYAHPPPVAHSSRSLRSALARSPPRPVGSLAVLASPAVGFPSLAVVASVPSRCSPRFHPVSPRFPRGAHRLTGSPPRPVVRRLAPSSVDVEASVVARRASWMPHPRHVIGNNILYPHSLALPPLCYGPRCTGSVDLPLLCLLHHRWSADLLPALDLIW
jgi:hypothetical protein